MCVDDIEVKGKETTSTVLLDYAVCHQREVVELGTWRRLVGACGGYALWSWILAIVGIRILSGGWICGWRVCSSTAIIGWLRGWWW